MMFDLNELPEDDSEVFSSLDVELLSAQSIKQSTLQNFVWGKEPESEIARTLGALKPAPTQFTDTTPIHLGQHPLSCFHPFVKQSSKGSIAEEHWPAVKEFCHADDHKGLKIVKVDNALHEPTPELNNGHNHIKVEDAPETTEYQSRHDSVGSNTCQDILKRDQQSNNGVLQEGGKETFLPPISSNDTPEKSDNSKGNQAVVENRSFSNFGKRGRLEHKDAMLGKKHSRQTIFLDVREAAKQATPPKTPVSKKSLFSSHSFHNVKDVPKAQPPPFDSRPKILNPSRDTLRGPTITSSLEPKSSTFPCQGMGQTGASDGLVSLQPAARSAVAPVVNNDLEGSPRQNGYKPGEPGNKVKGFHCVNQPAGKQGGQGTSGGEEKASSHVRPVPKKIPSSFRKQVTTSQDSSIVRLHREATCDKLWKPFGEAELQCVPGSFDSVQEYVNVFEPLLFEECRAQLRNTWEELCEDVVKDPHVQIYVKMIEKRERGWYELVLFPVHSQTRLGFKEGDVAVISTPKPGSGGSMRRIGDLNLISSSKVETPTRTAGIVRRHVPIDTRELHGATLRVYVGESSSTEDLVKKKYQSKGNLWYLTVLGSLATTQREYVALHAFQNLQSQMIRAILNPKPEHFPCYEEEPPAMPECFTQPFVQHLHRNFNNPQLAAIKWAAMHTAAGSLSSHGLGKRQDSWPFTLVQGPPGTGKTHTVWGMLNVIHLVQYQRYYGALLKRLAPDSLKGEESTCDSTPCHGGGLDDLLQKMDKNLARSLPKLCPKPRMLVSAPSNAATDELLTRVLERGFIDGEMKLYRPDVARVGVDTQTRASQAVSVERRSDHLLGMSRDKVLGWLQQLRAREAFLAQQVITLQKELAAATAARSLGSVGIDPDIISARDQSRDTKLQQLAAIVEERDKVLVEMSRLFIVENRFQGGFGFSLEDARTKLEASFANEAEIVFTTVSSSGRRLFSHLTHGFDMAVIDEAAQASEAAVLPPLSLGAALVC